MATETSHGKNPRGRISQRGRGIGILAPEEIEKRARELAAIEGRQEVTDADRIAARNELSGRTASPYDESAEAVSTSAWGIPGSSGHQQEKHLPTDDRTLEDLAEEGVEEAEHDQMVRDRREARQAEKE